MKKYKFHIWACAICLLAFPSAGAAQKMDVVNTLEGKTFVIVLTKHNASSESTVSITDEITFVGNKVYSKTLRKLGFSAGDYSIKTGTDNGKTITLFIGEYTDSNEGTILWMGKVSENRIDGTLKWFSKSATWTFTGTLKYAAEDK